jgi:hypothetical protein
MQQFIDYLIEENEILKAKLSRARDRPSKHKHQAQAEIRMLDGPPPLRQNFAERKIGKSPRPFSMQYDEKESKVIGDPEEDRVELFTVGDEKVKRRVRGKWLGGYAEFPDTPAEGPRGSGDYYFRGRKKNFRYK